jgi:hypothetical protein
VLERGEEVRREEEEPGSPSVTKLSGYGRREAGLQ